LHEVEVPTLLVIEDSLGDMGVMPDDAPEFLNIVKRRLRHSEDPKPEMVTIENVDHRLWKSMLENYMNVMLETIHRIEFFVLTQENMVNDRCKVTERIEEDEEFFLKLLLTFQVKF